MPDFIGNIPVPEIVLSGVFPIIPDYPYGRAHRPEVIVHQFGSANAWLRVPTTSDTPTDAPPNAEVFSRVPTAPENAPASPMRARDRASAAVPRDVPGATPLTAPVFVSEPTAEEVATVTAVSRY